MCAYIIISPCMHLQVLFICKSCNVRMKIWLIILIFKIVANLTLSTRFLYFAIIADAISIILHLTLKRYRTEKQRYCVIMRHYCTEKGLYPSHIYRFSSPSCLNKLMIVESNVKHGESDLNHRLQDSCCSRDRASFIQRCGSGDSVFGSV